MTKIKRYIITEENCQTIINIQNPVVCKGCGGKIEPIETVDNSNNPTYWSGCVKCQMFDNGTTPKNYEIAKKMVLERHFRPYSHDIEPKKESEDIHNYWLNSQIKGAVSIVEDILLLNRKL